MICAPVTPSDLWDALRCKKCPCFVHTLAALNDRNWKVNPGNSRDYLPNGEKWTCWSMSLSSTSLLKRLFQLQKVDHKMRKSANLTLSGDSLCLCCLHLGFVWVNHFSVQMLLQTQHEEKWKLWCNEALITRPLLQLVNSVNGIRPVPSPSISRSIS